MSDLFFFFCKFNDLGTTCIGLEVVDQQVIPIYLFLWHVPKVDTRGDISFAYHTNLSLKRW